MPTPLPLARLRWAALGSRQTAYSRLSAEKQAAYWAQAIAQDPYNPGLHGLRAHCLEEAGLAPPDTQEAREEAPLDLAALTGSRLLGSLQMSPFPEQSPAQENACTGMPRACGILHVSAANSRAG